MNENIIKEFSNIDVIYFDTSGRSIQPQSVTNIGEQTIKSKSKPWQGLGGNKDEVKTLRSLFSQLIHDDSDGHNIALTPSTGFAMTLAAQNVVRCGGLKAGETIIVLENEMGSVIYPWQQACEQTGAHFKVIPTPISTSLSWSDSIIQAIDTDVAVLALPCVHWCDGSLIELEKVSLYLQEYALLHPNSRCPLLIVDVTQSLGALPFDVQIIKPDYLACSIHKWLQGPYGMSLVYVHPSLHGSWQPLDQHERARLGSDQPMWDETLPLSYSVYTPTDKSQLSSFYLTTSGYPSAFFAGARRLDSGGRPNPVLVPMAVAALKLVLEWGVDNIQEYLLKLINSLRKKLSDTLGPYLTFPSSSLQYGSHILGLRLSPLAVQCGLADWSGICTDLAASSVYVSVRGSCLRISPYIHNTLEHVNTFTSLLTQLMQQRLYTHLYPPFSTPPDPHHHRILITGSAGWLAQSLYERCLQALPLDRYALFGAFNSKVPVWFAPQNRVYMDCSSYDCVCAAIMNVRPTVIIHLAAISSPVQCHADPTRAYRVNCPTELVAVVKLLVPQCLFLFTSTDMVYDGFDPPYTAFTSNHSSDTSLASASSSSSSSGPTPINVYGQTKLAFEQCVLSELQHVYVLRLSNMIGRPHVYRSAGAKFLQFVYDAYRKRQYIGNAHKYIHNILRK